MTFDLSSYGDAGPDAADVPPPDSPPQFSDVLDGAADQVPEVPTQGDVLPDGEPNLITGDVRGLADFNHQQGDNDLGLQGDCGLVSIQDVLNQLGIPASESDVVDHAAQNGECQITDDPTQSGGTTVDGQVQILNDFGVPARATQIGSLEELAQNVEDGRPTIIEANAGVLWNDATYYDNGGANHAVTVTGVSRDPVTGEIQGFYVNDSGNGIAGEYIDANGMTQGWLDTGGQAVVTDATTAGAPAPARA